MLRKFLVLTFALMLISAVVTPAMATNRSQETAKPSQVEGETIRIGTNAEYPPFEEVNEDGDIVGFDVDVMEALAADAGFEIEWVNTRWDGIFFALAEGEFDAVISAATITAPRERVIDFSNPYFVASQSISVRTDMAEDIATPDDLAGLKVGVQTGTTGDAYASEIEGVEVVRFDEATLAFQALSQGDVDATIVDTPASAAIIANNPDIGATIVGDPLTEEFYGIAVRPDFPELLDALNTSLANIYEDGTYAAIHEEHFGAEPPEYLLTGDYELDVFVVDMTDPASVAAYGIYTVLELHDLEEYAAITCEEYLGSEDAPTEETLAQIEGFTFDLSGLTYEATVEDDMAVVVADGVVSIDDGTQVVELALGDITNDATIELTMNEDGTWTNCPVLEGVAPEATEEE